MTTRRPSPGRRSPWRQRPKRSYGWLNSSLLTQNLVAGGITSFDLLGGLTLAEKRNVARVDRLFGEIQFRAVSANFGILARLGAIVVSDDAMALGNVPDPFSDDESSWYFNQILLWDEPTVEYHRVQFDARTRRRIPQGYTLTMALENSSASLTSMDWMLGARLLYLMT